MSDSVEGATGVTVSAPITVTMSFNAKCGGGNVLAMVKNVLTLVSKKMRYSISNGSHDRAGASKDGARTKSNTRTCTKIGRVGGRDMYVVYRKRPFLTHCGKIRSNMNNAVVLHWGEPGPGGKSIKIFVNGVITSAGWLTTQGFTSFCGEMLATVFDGAKLIEGSTRCILVNTRGNLSATAIDTFKLRDALIEVVAGRTDAARVMIEHTSACVKFGDSKSKRSRIQINPVGQLKVFSANMEERASAWAFIEHDLRRCVQRQMPECQSAA
jgi:hypothetical protein